MATLNGSWASPPWPLTSKQAGRSSRMSVPASCSLIKRNRVVGLPSHPIPLVRSRPQVLSTPVETVQTREHQETGSVAGGQDLRVCHRLQTEYCFKQDVGDNPVQSQTLFSFYVVSKRLEFIWWYFYCLLLLSRFIIFDTALSNFLSHTHRRDFLFWTLLQLKNGKMSCNLEPAFMALMSP